MELEKILQKRLRGMAVRILACVEHTLAADLEGMEDNETHTLSGADLKVIRSEVLNAAGDTTRSLTSLLEKPMDNRISFDKDVIGLLNDAELDFIDNGETPTIRMRGDSHGLSKIRSYLKVGIVYNKIYTCLVIEDIVNHILPFLDTAQLVGIKVADGKYKVWRDAVCDMYLGGLDNE